MEQDHDEGQNKNGDAAVLEKLKIARHSAPVVLEILEDAPRVPVSGFDFFEAAATGALDSLGIVLAGTDAPHVDFGQL